MAEIGNVTVRVDAVITDEQYREAMGAVRAANERMDLLEAENDRLRELVKDFFDVPCQCLKCEHYNYEEDRCGLRDRACELGVEVD